MATIAAEAGVGVATLYRSFPSRQALLVALTHRSLEMVVGAASRAAAGDCTATESLARFLHQTIDHGPQLVLPLHGGPELSDPKTVALRADVRSALTEILERGQRAGMISTAVTTSDVVFFGALLAHPLPHAANWNATARRQVEIFLAGISTGSHRSSG